MTVTLAQRTDIDLDAFRSVARQSDVVGVDPGA